MNTPHTHQKRSHRWLVATPIAALVLALSMGGAIFSESLTGFVTARPANQQVIGNTVFQSDDDATIDVTSGEPVLTEGTVLVASRVIATVHAGDLTLMGWNGGFSVTKAGDSVTVAALTTPVFVRQGNHQTIVPAFMQWKAQSLAAIGDGAEAWYASREPRALPDLFTQKKLADLEAMKLTLPTTTAPLSSALIPQLDSFLRLSAANNRAIGATRLARLAAIRMALNSSSDQLEQLLGAWDVKDIFDSTEAKNMIPLLLSDALTHEKGDLFLSMFVQDSSLATIAAFHPLVRDHARVLPLLASATADERAALLLMTTAADTQPQALADLTIRQWKAEWESEMQSGSGVLLFAGALPILQAHIERLDALQYPERVDAYASAVLELADPLNAGLPTIAQTSLNAIRALRDARRAAAPITDSTAASLTTSSSSSVSSTVTQTIAPEILVDQAKNLLIDAGFMITSQTEFAPVANTVSVREIIAGTTHGDIALAFTFDPATSVVSSIQKDGAILPYAIGLQQLKEWLRQ